MLLLAVALCGKEIRHRDSEKPLWEIPISGADQQREYVTQEQYDSWSGVGSQLSGKLRRNVLVNGCVYV